MLKRSYIINISILIIILIYINSIVIAQKIVSTSGEAQVRMERNMTEDDTRELAEQQAIINAIENAFGTYTEQQTDMTIKDGMTSFNIIGTTKVKGDWIETTDINFKENFKKEKTDNGIVNIKYITCEVSGKARKSRPKANIEYEILNQPSLYSRTRSFYHEEQLYVYFKSPVNGYASIFLEDDDAVYRLLPYVNMRDEFQSGVPVKRDTDYVFFSTNDNSYPGNPVDEQLLLSLKEDVEYNFIYIVFSEDEFVKPMLDDISMQKGRIIPKQLTNSKFQQWLARNRSVSEKFQDIRIKVSIEQKK